MGVGYLIKVVDEIARGDIHASQVSAFYTYIYECNMELEEALTMILKPQYLFHMPEHVIGRDGYCDLAMIVIWDWQTRLLDKVLVMKERSMEMPVEGGLWEWLDGTTTVHRRIYLDEACGYIFVEIRSIDQGNYMIEHYDEGFGATSYDATTQYVHPSIGMIECINEIRYSEYKVYVKKDLLSEYLIEKLPRLLKFLKRNYPFIIKDNKILKPKGF